MSVALLPLCRRVAPPATTFNRLHNFRLTRYNTHWERASLKYLSLSSRLPQIVR